MGFDWNEIAAEYAAIDEARRDVVFPRVLSRLRDMRAQSVIDFGCGDGLFASAAARQLNARVVAYDPSPTMLALARANAEGNLRVEVLDDSAGLSPGSFDAVVMNALWMCLETDEDCLEVLREGRRLLAPTGRLIASVTHPCFREHSFSTHRTKFCGADYLQNGTKFEVIVEAEGQRVTLVDTHWNLSAMSGQLDRAGFVICGINEVPDRGASGSGVPPWLIMEAMPRAGAIPGEFSAR